MELKNISQIISLNSDERVRYIVDTCNETHYPYEVQQLLDFFNLCSLNGFTVPFDNSFNVLNLFVAQYFRERELPVETVENLIFEDNDVELVVTQHFTLVLTNSQVDSLRTLVAMEEFPQLPVNRLRPDLRNLLLGMHIISASLLPTNSETLNVREETSRFSSAIWYENITTKVITLAGVGGIGSYIGFLLARMQPKSMFIYDNDIVEAANMSGQLYSREDIGMTKVDALARMVGNYANYGSVFAVAERFTEETEASDIMICGFDNMAARNLFYHKWKELVMSKPEEDRGKCLFIDGRLAAEEFQVLCIKGDDAYNMTVYETKYLFTDAQADATICSYKQTTYMANMIGSIITNLFVNFCANECHPIMDRDLPFYTYYDGSTMYFTTEN